VLEVGKPREGRVLLVLVRALRIPVDVVGMREDCQRKLDETFETL
jgi:hypothetical protein